MVCVQPSTERKVSRPSLGSVCDITDCSSAFPASMPRPIGATQARPMYVAQAPRPAPVAGAAMPSDATSATTVATTRTAVTTIQNQLHSLAAPVRSVPLIGSPAVKE